MYLQSLKDLKFSHDQMEQYKLASLNAENDRVMDLLQHEKDYPSLFKLASQWAADAAQAITDQTKIF